MVTVLTADLVKSSLYDEEVLEKVLNALKEEFVHIMDIEGNKLELWEPNDVEFEKLGEKIGAKTTK